MKKMANIKFEDFINLIASDESKLYVVGQTDENDYDLYRGDVKKLRKILMVNEIIKQKNWGGLDPQKCFIVRDVDSIDSCEDGLIKVYIKMPEDFTNTDADGNPLDDNL